MSGAHHKQLVEQFWNVILNDQQYDLVPVLLGPAYGFNGVPTPVDATVGWVKGLYEKYPDLHFTIEDILADDTKVAPALASDRDRPRGWPEGLHCRHEHHRVRRKPGHHERPEWGYRVHTPVVVTAGTWCSPLLAAPPVCVSPPARPSRGAPVRSAQ